WRETTVRAALATAEKVVMSGAASVAAQSLTNEVLKPMMLQNLKLLSLVLGGAGLMAWATTAALSSRGEEPQRAVPAPAAAVRPATPTLAPQPVPESDPLDAVGAFPVRGRVLDSDGKPVAGAEIYVHPYSFDVMTSATTNAVPAYQSGRVTASDAEGRFHFE